MAKRDYYLFVTEDGRRIPRVRWRSWAFVLFSGLLLAAVAIIDRGGIDEIVGTGGRLHRLPGGGRDRTAERALGPEPGRRAGAGRSVAASGSTARSSSSTGFRELEDGRWASNEFLTPVPGTDCG